MRKCPNIRSCDRSTCSLRNRPERKEPSYCYLSDPPSRDSLCRTSNSNELREPKISKNTFRPDTKPPSGAGDNNIQLFASCKERRNLKCGSRNVIDRSSPMCIQCKAVLTFGCIDASLRVRIFPLMKTCIVLQSNWLAMRCDTFMVE